MYKSKAIEEMLAYFDDAPFWPEHTLQVLQEAEAISEGENLEPEMRERIALTAILHDIGAIEAQRKHGSMQGEFQELEGPAVARRILMKIGYDPEQTDRICYIVGNHHSPAKIDGLDFQIQWEADLLINLATREIRHDREKLRAFIEENFKTRTGKGMAEERYLNE